VQQVAKQVLWDLAAEISPADTERSIAEEACAGLSRQGIDETWYYACPAFVLLGSRSCLSVSGRDYMPSLEPVGETNVVTVDLSPMRSGHWGDCARSYFVEDGRATREPRLPEFTVGRDFLKRLHADMLAFVDDDTTFHQLYEWTNDCIAAACFQNLDFKSNVGHSIAKRREDRQYVSAGNHAKLCESLFTFEPHVRSAGGRWGFKHENIFFFNAARRIEEL
jgi:hypothetical protein